MREAERVLIVEVGKVIMTACGGGVRAEERSGEGRLDLQSSSARASPEKQARRRLHAPRMKLTDPQTPAFTPRTRLP